MYGPLQKRYIDLATNPSDLGMVAFLRKLDDLMRKPPCIKCSAMTPEETMDIKINFITLEDALERLPYPDTGVKPMLVDYMELRKAQEKISEQSDIIKQLRIELSESRQIARDMVQSADVSKALEQERERCAKICETLPLVLPHPEHYSFNERHIILVSESGCRGAFAQAIRGIKMA